MTSQGQISNEALDAALQRVNYMFPSTVSSFQLNPKSSFQRTASAPNGRNRVDSQARPPEFIYRLNRADGKKINCREFIVHGVQEPILRQRIATNTIDESIMDRVLQEFQLHDKLSDEDLSKLHDLAEQAYRLHKNHDDINAEHLFEEAIDLHFIRSSTCR